MKNLNKFILIVASCTLCLLSIFCSTVFASGTLPFVQQDWYLNWAPLPIKEDVPINKVWSIKFTQPINKSSLDNSSIYIEDDKLNIVDISLQLSEDGKVIKILPTSNYSPGHPYYLYVTNRVMATSGYSLSKPTCMTFTVKADATKVDDTYNKQSIKLSKGDVLELTLPENDDGGYSWKFKSSLNNNILKIIDDTYIQPSSSPNIVGGVGKKRWLVQAMGTGTTSINLEEARPWDTNSTLSTFNLKVTVK
jgi:predicted secreted protein